MTYVVTSIGRRMMRPLAKSRSQDEPEAIRPPVGDRLSALSFLSARDGPQGKQRVVLAFEQPPTEVGRPGRAVRGVLPDVAGPGEIVLGTFSDAHQHLDLVGSSV